MSSNFEKQLIKWKVNNIISKLFKKNEIASIIFNKKKIIIMLIYEGYKHILSSNSLIKKF